MPTIRSSRVVTPEGTRPATIRFEEGVVVAVGEGAADVDYGDLVVLPGLVDSHVHVNEPGRTDWEGFATATRAALAGGTTTIVDMPLNSVPPTVDSEALRIKRDAARPKVVCDVAFWGGVVPGSEGDISDLAADGVCGFKVFMVDSGVPEFPPLDARSLADVCRRLSGLDVPVVVHAETASLLAEPAGDPRRYSTYLATRPPEAEADAIVRVAKVREGALVHILHVSSGEAVEAVRANGVSGETCPHYLTFDADQIPDGATAFKCAPPIRAREHRERLWEALTQGVIGMVVSDHSPAPLSCKEVGSGNFVAAWGGIASVELRLAAVWTGARERGIPLQALAGWLASNPARLAGLDHRKGSIEIGGDADFAVFDPDGLTEVQANRLRQRHPITPYDGMALTGAVVATWLGGELAYGTGASAHRGKLLTRGG